jgi:serine phosphatase RsbU (regulator of sigma subunit)
MWSVLMLAAYLSHSAFHALRFPEGESVWAFLVFPFPGLLESCTGAFLLRRCLAMSGTLSQLKELLGLAVVAGLCSTALGAVVGAAIVVTQYPTGSYWSVWQVFWFGDALGILVVAPVVLTWAGVTRQSCQAPSARRLVEVSVLFVAMLVVAQFVFGAASASALSFFDLPYLVFLFLLWAALRFDPHIVATASLALTLLLIWNANHGRGPFIIAGRSVYENILALQVYLAVTPFSALILSAVVTARRRAEHLVAEYNQTLEQQVVERTEQLAQANAAITALNAQLQAENLRMGTELEVTRKLQYMLLPTVEELHQIAHLDIACYMEPADEVGGDYYDILQHNGQIKIGIGDVTGHGLESGVLMVMTQAIVRALLAHGETDPVRFLDTLNRTLYGNVQRMGTDKNLTLSLLDYVAGEVRLSGQHEEMLVVRQDGSVERVETIDLGLPIGLVGDITDYIQHRTVVLRPGDGVVLYTDGIPEAENAVGEQYGLERLCAVVGQHWVQQAEAIKEAVVADVRRHIGSHRVYDDLTLVVVKQR